MKKIKTIFKVLLVFLIFFFGRYFQLIPIWLFSLKDVTPTGGILLSTFSNIMIGIIFYLLYRKELKKEFKRFKDNFNECFDVGTRYWLIGLLVMMASNILISLFFQGQGATNEKMVQDLIDVSPLIMLINTGIIGPFLEEIMFRKTFKKIFHNKGVFILMSGLVFGSLHVLTVLTSPSELLYIIPYTSLGISLAMMYVKTDTIFTSITMHMFHNIILTLLSFL